MKNIGFIGVGVMGASMVRNLMKNGFNVSVYTRTKEKAAGVIDEGAAWRGSVAQCTAGQDAIITMVGYPKDVEEVYFKEAGIIASASPGTHLIDMTTTSPALSARIQSAAAARGLSAVDAPVSGGDVGARNGTLSIMAGGDREAFDKCQPLLSAMGTARYVGPAGAGQHAKMANQIALAGAIAGVCEAIAYTKSMGLDVQTVLNCISRGAAGSWQMDNMAPRMLDDDMAPGFFIKHYIKDMDIALEEAELAGRHLPILNQVAKEYRSLSEKGMDDLGTQALIRYYEG